MMDATAPPPDSTAAADPPHALRALLAASLDSLRTRVELAGVEFQMYVLLLARLLVWALGALACALLGLAFALVALIVSLWDTHRMLALLGGSALFIALAVTFGWLGARTFSGQRLDVFAGSLEQLREDVRRTGGAP
jgi:uncharacterized membrane protein YqjE